jgi:hypothetical protein
MTSIAAELPVSDRPADLWNATIAAVTAAFGRQFSRKPRASTLEQLLSPNETLRAPGGTPSQRIGLAHLP